jgi:hypothetical protein
MNKAMIILSISALAGIQVLPHTEAFSGGSVPRTFASADACISIFVRDSEGLPENGVANAPSAKPAKFEMPPGYGLNTFDANLALQIPSAKMLMEPMLEIAKFLDKANKDELSVIAKAAEKVSIEEAKRRGGFSINNNNLQRMSTRNFPQKFYNTYLSKADVSEAEIREIFLKLDWVYDRYNFSSEALVMLAFAARDINAEQAKANLEIRTELGRKNIIDRYIYDAEARNRLPTYRDFFDSHPELLIKVASIMRAWAIDKLGKSPNEFKFNYSDNLRILLMSKQLHTLETRLRVAVESAEPILQPYIKNQYGLLLAPAHVKKRIQKWEMQGSYVLRDLVRTILAEVDFILSHEFKGVEISISRTQAILKSVLLKYTNGENSKEYEFLHGAVQTFYDQSYFVLTDTNQISAKTIAGMADFGLKIRALIKEHKRAEKEEAKQKIIAAVKTQSASIEISKRGSTDSTKGDLAAGHLARLMRRASKQADAVDSRPSEVEQKALEEAAALAVPEEGAIDIETLRTVGADSKARYFFMNREGIIEYAVFDRGLATDLNRKNIDLSAWLDAFLKGVRSDKRNEWLKEFRSSKKGNLWEVKLGSTGNRIFVTYDEEQRTWKWELLVEHKKTDFFRKSKGF